MVSLGRDSWTAILAQRLRVTTAGCMRRGNYPPAKLRSPAASFIRGSAWWRDVAALQPRGAPHDDDIFPRCGGRVRIPVPDQLGLCANRDAGRACADNQGYACGKEGGEATQRRLA